MVEERVHRRLAAIHAADVVGYSRLMGEDEERTLAALTAHRVELIEPGIAEHEGRVVKTTGDGVLAEFPSVVDTVRSALAVQTGMWERVGGAMSRLTSLGTAAALFSLAPLAEAGPLHDAVERGDINQVMQEITNGEDVNEEDVLLGMPLHIAARGGHIAVAEVLIERGAAVNAKDVVGTPLDAAVLAGEVGTTKLLITSGADITVKNNAGLMPLHTAAIAGQIEIVEMLIDQGVKLNAKGDHGNTALHFAAREGHTNMVDQLIAKGADIDARGYLERTPLHLAAERGHKDVVELLLDNGADINARTQDRFTPLELAVSRRRTETAETLRQRGATM